MAAKQPKIEIFENFQSKTQAKKSFLGKVSLHFWKDPNNPILSLKLFIDSNRSKSPPTLRKFGPEGNTPGVWPPPLALRVTKNGHFLSNLLWIVIS